MPTLYAFEARSIQRYILRSNRLREMVGASALVDRLCGDQSGNLLDKVISALKIEQPDFARRAGGAFLAVFKDLGQAEKLRDAWSFYVQQTAPGLGFVHAIAEGPLDGDTEERLEAMLRASRNRAPTILPQASPLTWLNPLTALPAVDFAGPENESLDEISLVKHRYAENAGHALEEKIDLKGWVWPKVLVAKEGEEDEDALVSEDEENATIGVIHADGNGLGNIVHKLKRWTRKNPERFVEVRSKFSKAVDEATRKAARETAQSVLRLERPSRREPDKWVLPARFLVLGGDDLTLIVRGHLAFEFAKTFLERFEEKTREALAAAELPQELFNELPKGLTATAGIALIKAGQPFYQAYNLADSLCRAAKDTVSRHIAGTGQAAPSAIACHRITTSVIDRWEPVLKRELTAVEGRILTRQPYLLGVHELDGFSRFSDLEALADALAKAPSGSVRELARLLYQGEARVQPALRRWREILGKRHTDILSQIETGLARLNGPETEGWVLPIFNGNRRTPLLDALTLNSVRAD